MTAPQQQAFDIAVIGGGATGAAAALAAAISGFDTVLFAPQAAFPPGRTAALLQGSVDLLADLDVWPSLTRHAAALRAIRIVDATRRLLRAPEVTFWASEIGLPAFGFNVPNGELVEALRRRVELFDKLRLIPSPVAAVEPEAGFVRVRSAEADVTARLAVAADGFRSLARQAAGIEVRSWSYRQSALVATFAVEHAHSGISTEFHTENGPFTLVPLPGNRMSLVWVDRPERLRAAALLDADELSRLVEERAHSIHGATRLDSSPAVFPLEGILAERYAARRTVLVGEAAHRFPPIGAQGLNLGFRDVAAFRKLLVRHRDDPGAPAALDAYQSARQNDIRARTLAVDVLNRSLLTDFLPVQAARGLGLALASSVPPLRRALIRQGLAETARRR